MSRFLRLNPVTKLVVRGWQGTPFFAKVTAGIVILVALAVMGTLYVQNRQYTISDAEQKLLGVVSVDKKLIKDTGDSFEYNRTTDQKVNGQNVVLAAANTEATGKFPYKVTLPKDAGKGISFSNDAGDLSFKIIPNFGSSTGREQDGRVRYAKGNNEVHVYTLKRNGVKQDIIVRKAIADTLKYQWTIEAGDKLEAKMLPNGSIGLYSADPMLTGKISADSQSDKDLLAKAQKNAAKTNLAFILPTPYIVDANGTKVTDGVSYTLKGNILTLEATNLKAQSYPLSIDPTIVVTTTADFASGSDDGMIDYTTANQIQRDDLSFGQVGVSTTQSAAFTSNREGQSSVVANGYLYIIGGGAYRDDIQYCPLNANGSVGACVQQLTAFATARANHTSVVNNGYLYIIGGYNGGYLNDIQYCPLNAGTGAVGNGGNSNQCTQTSTFTTARAYQSSVVANGNLYIIGGFSGVNQDDIQYCPFKADGSLGSCVQQTNAFTSARNDHASVVYNNFLYIIGGNTGSDQNDIQYCPLNPTTGAIGTGISGNIQCIQQTNAFTTARDQLTSVVSDGYLYIIGGSGTPSAAGCDSSGYCNDIQYCPINANGSVGACTQQIGAIGFIQNHSSIISNGFIYVIGGRNGGGVQSTIMYVKMLKQGAVGVNTSQAAAFASARSGASSVVYNGYLYIIGGQAANSATGCNATGYCSDIQYCPLNAATGVVGVCTTQLAAFTTARSGHTSVVANNFLYIIGGTQGFASTDILDDIQHCPINVTTGAVGACVQQTAIFSTKRMGHSSVVANGYLYIIGGASSITPTLQNTIDSCLMDASTGAVSTCTSAGTFTTARYEHTSVADNGYLYIIGGWNGVTKYNNIQYCAINASTGAVTGCSATSTFTTARYDHTSVISKGYLYIIGGNNGGGFDDIQYCPINESTGALGTCVQQLTAFTTARYGHTSVAANGYLYIIGGNSGTLQNDIQYLKIMGFGSPTTITQQTSAFPAARQLQTSVVADGYLYIIGGKNISVLQNDIQYCSLNESTGATVSCTDQLAAFTTARSGHTSIVNNGYIYIIGGDDGTSKLNDIQRCPINPSTHAIDTCTQQTNAFTTARTQHSSIIANGYLYIIGGFDGTNRLNDIQRCALDPSTGAAGTCTQQTSAFTTPRNQHSSSVYNNYLYIIGGFDGTNRLNDIQYCALNPSTGAVGACTVQSNLFARARSAHTSEVYNGYLYIISGADGVNTINDILYCKLNSSGSVGQCDQYKNAYTQPRISHSTVIANGFLYMIGGFSGAPLNDVQYTKLATRYDGSYGAKTQQTAAFTEARNGHTSVVANGYLYIIGGVQGGFDKNDIQYCPLNTNGSVGACTQQTNAFTTARSEHTSVVANGYLYIIGGYSGGYLNDIQYCPLNSSNGSVGTCIQQNSAFTTTRRNHSSVVANGYLYIIGGISGSGNLNDIQHCPLNADGSVGTCVQQASAFTTARSGHSSVVANGYLYIIGGYSSGYLNSIEYCLLNPSTGAVGSCTLQAAAFTEGRTTHTSVMLNGYLYIMGGSTLVSGEQSDMQYCPLDANSGAVGTCTLKTNFFTTGRYEHTSVVANGYLYIIGGKGAGGELNDIQYSLISGQPQRSIYSRTVDLGLVSTLANSIGYNGTASCGIDVTYQSAGSNGIYGSKSRIADLMPGITYPISELGARYVLIQIDSNDSTCGNRTTITDVTVGYTTAPSAPAMISPAASATGVAILPQFQLRSSDVNNDYIRYKIQVCSNADCSSVVRTIDQTASQTGWTGQDAQTNTAYVGNATLTSSTIATHNYQASALSYGTQYWWRAYGIDPGGENIFGPVSAIQSFRTQSVPAAPTLTSPSGAGALGMPVFALRSTDADGDYLRYKLEICTTSNCSSILRTVDQTASQTGWAGQDQQVGTAYTGNAVIGSSKLASYTYAAPALTPSTQYWWRAYAIDPGGSNTFSTVSSIGTFTVGPYEIRISGGVKILGGTRIGN